MTVHPRVRGERHFKSRKPGTQDGSSPRARGTRGLAVLWFGKCRFIPACAGNAFAALSTTAVPAVHPRVRGERICARCVFRRAILTP